MKQIKKYKKKKRLGSFPYLSVIFSTSLALFVIGIFSILLLFSFKITNFIQENVEIQLYLNKNISESQKIRIQKTLSEKDYLANSPEAIQFISKEEAAKEFIEATGEDFIDFLGENPLRDAFSIKIASDFHSNDQMALIKKDLEQLSGVFEVVYTENLVQNINENITKIGIVLLAIASILLLTVIILINNTIKLALFSQRFLIRSMQLVGAKSSFITWPFLKRSVLHGIIAGVISSLGIVALLLYGQEKVIGLAELYQPLELAILATALCVLGLFIAFLSTLKAINKYLNMSLDELY